MSNLPSQSGLFKHPYNWKRQQTLVCICTQSHDQGCCGGSLLWHVCTVVESRWFFCKTRRTVQFHKMQTKVFAHKILMCYAQVVLYVHSSLGLLLSKHFSVLERQSIRRFLVLLTICMFMSSMAMHSVQCAIWVWNCEPTRTAKTSVVQ